jgi:hypothetical protein
MTDTLQTSKTENRLAAFTAIALLGFAASSASAEELKTATGNLFDQRTVQFGTAAANQTTMGAWKVNETNGPQGFWVYCMDPLNSYASPDTYDKTSLSNFVSGGGYATLFAAGAAVKDQAGNITKAASGYQAANVVGQYDDSTTSTTKVLRDLTNLYSHAYADSLTDAKKSAAFQYAIWEIEGDGAAAYSRSAGGLKYTGTDTVDLTFTKTVDAYLAGLNTGTWATGLTTVTNYAFTVYNPNPAGGQALLSVKAVPEPGSLALAGLALFGAVYTRRQNKAKQA